MVDGSFDPQRSSVEFRVGQLWGLLTVKGHFADYEGRLDLSATPAIEVTIAAASVQTGNRKRDQHLRSADFLDAENHPRVRFVSDSVDLLGHTLTARGRLFARDQAIPLEVNALVREVDGELEIEAATAVPHRASSIHSSATISSPAARARNARRRSRRGE